MGFLFFDQNLRRIPILLVQRRLIFFSSYITVRCTTYFHLMYDKMRELCAMKMVLFHGHTDRHRKTKFQFSPSPAAIIPFGTSKADIGRKKKTHTTNDKMMNRIARIDGTKKKNTKSIAACHNRRLSKSA